MPIRICSSLPWNRVGSIERKHEGGSGSAGTRACARRAITPDRRFGVVGGHVADVATSGRASARRRRPRRPAKHPGVRPPAGFRPWPGVIRVTPWVLRPTCEISAARVRTSVPPSEISSTSWWSRQLDRADQLAVAGGGLQRDHALGAAALARVVRRPGCACRSRARWRSGCRRRLRPRSGCAPPRPRPGACRARRWRCGPSRALRFSAKRTALPLEANSITSRLAIGQGDADQRVAFVEVDRDLAARQAVGELGQRGLLDRAVLGGEKHELAVVVFAHRQHRLHLLAGFQRDPVDDRAAARVRSRLRATGTPTARTRGRCW